MREILTYIAAHYGIWILLGSFFAIWFCLIFLTACWEKHPVHQFRSGAPEEFGPPSRYFLAMNDAARARNLEFCGHYLQFRQSRLYRCVVSFWLTPDHNTLLTVWGGKLARMDYKRTLLISVTAAGREIITMDLFGIVDLSGLRDIQMVLNADMDELFARHLQRIAANSVPLRPFSPARCLDQYEELGRVRAEKMVSMRLAKFLEISESNWRYTVKGAFQNAWAGYIQGMREAKRQSSRRNKKRPGS